MEKIKKYYNFILTYLIRPFLYRFFVFRWELFRKPPYFFKYYGYKVFYRPKDGLVYHIGSLGSFEKDVITCAKKLIPDNAIVFDIGANIGLITLPLARLNPRSFFHCFEPSPYPYQFFNKTISKNKLQNRIKLNKIGLYNRSGNIKFYTHQDKNASGDGIKDTHRAGTASPINIRVTTIDKYVMENRIPKMNLLKIDIEGAELFVFKGGLKSIQKFKPVIIFEAWPKNLEAYKLNITDLYNFFNSIKYSIYSLNGKFMNMELFLKETKIQGNYLALPIK